MTRPIDMKAYVDMARGTDLRGAVPQTIDNARPIRKKFIPQSYFDSTLLQKALLLQGQNDGIVASTIDAEPSNVPGYALASSPASETPVAVKFFSSRSAGDSVVQILRPGQMIRPLGGEAFAGFQYGLPFGWLGGGAVTLHAFASKEASLFWVASSPEIIYHRLRLQIVADSGSAPTLALNWPTRFPWPDAVRGANSAPQGGQPGLAVTPTKVALRLRLNNLAAPASMRVLFRGTLGFDWDSAGTNADVTNTTDVGYVDIAWPQVTQGAAGEVVTQPGFPLVVTDQNHPLTRLGCEGGGISLTDNTNASLTEALVDIVRFGCV